MAMSFEHLESRDLLAADVQVLHDPLPQVEVGEEVTQTIRVFSDEAGDVKIRSLVSSQLENPTWQRFEGHGNKLRPLSPSDADFAIKGAEFNREIGDVNGDDATDFLFALPNSDFVIIYGGLSEGLDFSNPDSTHIGPTIRVQLGEAVQWQPSLGIQSIGDINGDGFDDLAFQIGAADNDHLAILFGGDNLGDKLIELTTEPSEDTVVITNASALFGIGDLNGDGFGDAVFGQLQHGAFFTQLHAGPGHLLLGNAEFERGRLFTYDELIASNATTISLGSVRQASSIGDFNNDGFDDAVIVPSGIDAPQVLYGGSDPADLITLTSFNSIEAGLGIDGGYVTESYRYAGSGDVNGDTIADIVLSFNGGDCSCGASGRPNVTGGVVVIHGGENPHTDRAYRPFFADNTNVRIDGVSGFLGATAQVGNFNDDALTDILLVSDGNLEPDFEPINIVMLGRSDIKDVDFGHLYNLNFENEWQGLSDFDGQNIFGFTGNVEVADVNADGKSDVMKDSQVFLGRERVAQANGISNIDETVLVSKNQSVIYEVTGTLKSLDAISTTAIRTDLLDTNLSDNIQSVRDGVLLNLDPSDPKFVDNQIEIGFSITNDGPAIAKNVELIESISGSLTEVQWEISQTAFPEVIALGDLKSGLGVQLGGTESVLLWYIEGGITQSQSQRYFGELLTNGLGTQVGNLGDRNEDGVDDVYVAQVDSTGELTYLQFDGSADFATAGFPKGVAIRQPPQTNETKGDFNGDGLNDVVRWQPNAGDNRRGEVHVLFGTSNGEAPKPGEIDGTNGFVIGGNGKDFVFESESAWGDINADGFDDLVLTYTNINNDYDGEAVVVFGNSGNLDAKLDVADVAGETGFRIEAGGGYDNSLRIASDFDINADGIDDLLIGNGRAGGPSAADGGPPWTAPPTSFSAGRRRTPKDREALKKRLMYRSDRKWSLRFVELLRRSSS